MKFINDQYEKYLQEEVNINRKKRIPDTRVHCCLYFIPATGHSYVPFGAFVSFPTLVGLHAGGFCPPSPWAQAQGGGEWDRTLSQGRVSSCDVGVCVRRGSL